MNPLNVLITLICLAGVVVLLAHKRIVAFLDKEVFFDIPSTEANEQRERPN